MLNIFWIYETSYMAIWDHKKRHSNQHHWILISSSCYYAIVCMLFYLHLNHFSNISNHQLNCLSLYINIWLKEHSSQMIWNNVKVFTSFFSYSSSRLFSPSRFSRLYLFCFFHLHYSNVLPDSLILCVVMVVWLGPERKSAVIGEKNRTLVAYHESGHAVVALFTEGIFLTLSLIMLCEHQLIYLVPCSHFLVVQMGNYFLTIKKCNRETMISCFASSRCNDMLLLVITRLHV